MPRALFSQRSDCRRAWGLAGASIRIALVLAAALWPQAAQGTEPASLAMVLTDELGEISHLEAGHDLFVSGWGFDPDSLIEITLRDELGWPVAQQTAQVGANGRLESVRLWNATGIVGCDCGVSLGPYAFARFEDAIADLPGRTFAVEINSWAGIDLATKMISFVAPQKKIAFPADAAGCPRFRFGDHEDVYFRVWSGLEGEALSVTLGPTDQSILSDVRSRKPEGDLFALAGPSTRVLIWPGESSFQGAFSLLAFGADWPATVPILADPFINSGIVVLDHECPAPPPEPG